MSTDSTGLSHPAEFEDQEATWIIWKATDHKRGYSTIDVVKQMILALTEPGQRVCLICEDEQAKASATSWLDQHPLTRSWVTLYRVPHIERWIRDTGPPFVRDDNGQIHMVDFSFNVWGYADNTSPQAIIDSAMSRGLADQLGLSLIETPLISEGGNREVNGRGTLMLTARVEEGRNPGWSRRAMEQEYQRVLGIRNVLWLEEGLLEDQHTFLGPIYVGEGERAYTATATNGHVDEYARFADPHTILLAQVPEEDRGDAVGGENHRRLEAAAAILHATRDQDGHPFRIIRLPMPKTTMVEMGPGDAVYEQIARMKYPEAFPFPKGKEVKVIAAASYLNMVITPKVILVPAYGPLQNDPEQVKRDEEVVTTLRKVFPDRNIVQLNALAINLGGGGMHCITLHQPKW